MDVQFLDEARDTRPNRYARPVWKNRLLVSTFPPGSCVTVRITKAATVIVTNRLSSAKNKNRGCRVGLTAKGVIAPRAAYEPVSASLIPVDTPGLTAVNPARYTFHRIRRPLFGIDQ
jgi:hypothetical protein